MSAPWAITYEGHTWTSESITVAEALDIALLAGGGWAALDPYGHPASLAAIVSVLRATRLGEAAEEAMLAVRAMPAAELMGCLVETPAGA